MGLRRAAAANPLAAALIAEALLIPLALLLALLLGQTPWSEFRWPLGTLLLSLAATMPLVGGLALFAALGPRWFRELDALVRPAVEALFGGRGHFAVVVAALLAGFGEELLFRGVLQAWLSGLIGPWFGVALAAIVFGLLHAVSRAYFVVATAMGLYLGALYAFTDNLTVVSLVHALYDWVAIEYVRLRIGDGGQQAPTEADSATARED